MAGKTPTMALPAAALAVIFLTAAVVLAGDNIQLPSNKGQLNSWFNQNVKPYPRPGLDPALAAAEQGAKVIRVRKDGSGDFKTINDAVKTIPSGNSKRVTISIGPGEYIEKVTIDKPFVSLVGSARAMPTISYGGTAKRYGTVDSATVIVLAPYFIAANLIIKNSAPRPDPAKKDGQALAFRINADKGAFYNVRFIGFQDTLCDDRGNHFFMDCYIEGTVDFIFGRGTSLYLNTELHCIGDKGLTVITAQGRDKANINTGFVFAHGSITGNGRGTVYLGRLWGAMPRVIYAYTHMSSVVQPEGWNDNFKPESHGQVFYGEYQNAGPGAVKNGRVKYSRELTKAEVSPFLTLGFIKASPWLLPPPRV